MGYCTICRPCEEFKSKRRWFVDSKLHEYFVQASFGELHEPTTILDIHGRIMAWFLPDIICKQCLVRFIR